MELQHVRKNCSAYGKHTRMRSTTQAGPLTSTELGMGWRGQPPGTKCSKGPDSCRVTYLWSYMYYRYDLWTFLGKKKVFTGNVSGRAEKASRRIEKTWPKPHGCQLSLF